MSNRAILGENDWSSEAHTKMHGRMGGVRGISCNQDFPLQLTQTSQLT